MKKMQVDVAVIGAGTAGLAAYRAARKAGRRAVLIEGGTYGTTCVKVGCMPSKLLIAAAEVAHSARHARDFGIEVGDMRVDGPSVLARVRRERDHFQAFVLKEVHEIPEADRLRGHARFIADTVLRVDAHTEVHANAVVIATGARAQIPEVFAPLGDRAVISDAVFEWSRLPDSVAVFGPGPVGLELGQALHRLGVRIRLFGDGDGLGGLSDPVIRRYARDTLAGDYALHPGVEIVRTERHGAGVRIVWREADGSEHHDDFSLALVATGRQPDLDGLDLDRTSAPRDQHGTPEIDRHTLQAGTAPIFVAGDANHQLPVLHEAHAEGLIAGTNAASFPNVQAAERMVPMSVVFSTPHIIQVGQRFGALDAERTVTGSVCFEEQGRSRILNERAGLLHVYVDRATGAVLGAEGIAPHGEHLAHLLAWTIQCEMRVQQALALPYYHPTIEEALRTVLRDAASKLPGGDADD